MRTVRVWITGSHRQSRYSEGAPWIGSNELSPVTQIEHKEAMKNIKRFFISPRRREIVDNTEVNRGLLHKAAKCDLEIFMPLGHAARSWLGHDHNSDVDFFSLPHGS